MTAKRHSESVLSDRRDRWWNDDFLDLLAARLALGQHDSVLDVGCGHGHWGQRLLPRLAPYARLSGVDSEPSWIARAHERAALLGVAERCAYRVAQAEALPFPDGSFSLVTCQTLLMHVRDPKAVLREMMRVLRPGGRLLLAEPSNVASQFSADSVQRALTPAEIADIAQLLVACSRGRARLGRGDDCVGDLLPGLLEGLGVLHVTAFQNDQAAPIRPPYDEHAAAQLDEELSYVTREFWLWDRKDARTLFEAGGGDVTRFDAIYGAFLRQSEVFAQQVRDGVYARMGASFHFVVTGVTSSASG